MESPNEEKCEIIQGCVYIGGEYKVDLHGGMNDGVYDVHEVDFYLNNLIDPLFENKSD